MRRRARPDANQGRIVEYLRSCGHQVFVTSRLGDGFPDLVVLVGGTIVLLEVKDGDAPPSQRKLTQAEEKFHREWAAAPVFIVYDEEDVEWVFDQVKKMFSPSERS